MQRRPNIRSHSVLFSCALQEICIDACHVRENALSIFIQYQMNFLTFLKNIWYLGLKFWKYGNCAIFLYMYGAEKSVLVTIRLHQSHIQL